MNIQDLAKEVKAAKEVIDTVSSILSDAARSVVVEFNNATSRTVRQVARNTPHGTWAQFPAGAVNAFQSDVFGTKSSEGGIATGTTATIDYAIDEEGTNLHLYWENPFSGANTYSLTLTGPNSDFYLADGIIAGGNKKVPARFVIAEKASFNPVEPAWRTCMRCKSLFYSFDDGLCPANVTYTTLNLPSGGGVGDVDTTPVEVPHYGAHEVAGWTLGVPYLGQAGPNREPGWRRCADCRSLFFDGWARKGRCPVSSKHHSAEPNGREYSLPFDIPLRPKQQSDWHFCTKCYVLFFWPHNVEGSCQAGGKHHAHAYNYVLDVVAYS
ncbi:hypothetical protein [Streptomyces sp. SP18BB07]|uniref:hypothetical protein n=1 Tax=Streptomyces sp. SP18BB07 TaxID=3002522 RepID=UPI002E775AB4|nr:hypothetical protein [Streptomyces sp. SP18BB07]MEE1758153.1 hypothetical protein [Streptomyces sp. SP18BB07]